MIIRLIIWVATIWLIVQIIKKIGAFFFQAKRQRELNRQVFGENPQDPLRMVQDPVCHIYLPAFRAIQQTRNQEMYYFCSRQCAEKFFKPYQV